MTESNFLRFERGLDVMRHLTTESEQAVYGRYMRERARAFGLAWPVAGGGASSQRERAIVRLSCLCRAQDEAAAITVGDAFRSLDSAEQKRLTAHLIADGIDMKPAFVLVDCP